jgi:hypothetical protein
MVLREALTNLMGLAAGLVIKQTVAVYSSFLTEACIFMARF